MSVKYLFVCAHPDDLEFNCGNIMADLSAAGADVTILSLTQGEFGTTDNRWKGRALAKIRIQELFRAAESNGIPREKVHFAGITDGFVRFDKETLEKVIDLINGFQPNIVFACEPYYTMYWHSDHINCGRLIYYIVKNQNNDKLPKKITRKINAVYFYTTFVPNFFWPFSDTARAYKALYEHKSQWALLKYNKFGYPLLNTNYPGTKRKLGNWKYCEKYRKVESDSSYEPETLKTKILKRLIYAFRMINPGSGYYRTLKEVDEEYYHYIEDLRKKYGYK